jgi:hypothetical protein
MKLTVPPAFGRVIFTPMYRIINRLQRIKEAIKRRRPTYFHITAFARSPQHVGDFTGLSAYSCSGNMLTAHLELPVYLRNSIQVTYRDFPFLISMGEPLISADRERTNKANSGLLIVDFKTRMKAILVSNAIQCYARWPRLLDISQALTATSISHGGYSERILRTGIVSSKS